MSLKRVNCCRFVVLVFLQPEVKTLFHFFLPFTAFSRNNFFLICRVSESIAETLRLAPQESSKVSTKDLLLSLLPNTSSPRLLNEQQQDSLASIKNLALACALLSSSRSSAHELLSWIPESLSTAGESAFSEISQGYFSCGSNDGKKMRLVNGDRVVSSGDDFGLLRRRGS